MQGFVVAEVGHVVNVIPSVNISGGWNGKRFTMRNSAHASIVLKFGVSAGAATAVLVNACTAATGGTKAAIPFKVYKQEVTDGDVLGPKTDVTAAGFAPSANDRIFYVIEIDGRALPEDSPWIELSVTNGSGNSCFADATAILSGERYQQSPTPTALV